MRKKIIYWLLTLLFKITSLNVTNLNIENNQQITLNKADTNDWVIDFLQYLSKRKFVLFNDDIKIDDLENDDLELIKPWFNNWLYEAIAFFNNDIYKQKYQNYEYNLVENIIVLGFNKKVDSNLFEIFLTYKGDINFWIYRSVKITFDLFNGSKKQFTDFLNNELTDYVLNLKELNFKNNTHNIQEWDKTRSDFFWKSKHWIIGFESEIKEAIIKLNNQFNSKISANNNILFYGWKNLINNYQGQLIFIYERFDIKIKIMFEFIDFFNTDLSILGLSDEINAIKSELDLDLEKRDDYDYGIEINANEFLKLDEMDIFLELSSSLNKFKQVILETWNNFFITNNIIAKFEYVIDDLKINDIKLESFHKENYLNVYIDFFTLQGHKITRIIQFNWTIEKAAKI